MSLFLGGFKHFFFGFMKADFVGGRVVLGLDHDLLATSDNGLTLSTDLGAIQVMLLR